MRGNPDGSLSSTVRLAPQGLLTFRYIEGSFSNAGSWRRLAA